LYETLSSIKTLSATVFLDACFSGANIDGQLLAYNKDTKGTEIVPKKDNVSGNLIVMSASSEESGTAYPYNEQQHGFFTYFLLKKLKETEGNVNYDDLYNYIKEKVMESSFDKIKQIQTPQIIYSIEMQNTWKNMKMK
jgi:hypothetical protein